jgi:hypothetical protein
MKNIAITEPTGLSGRKILGYSYSRSVKDLIGTWDMILAGSVSESYPYALGDEIVLPGMTATGMVTAIGRGKNGEFTVSGKDNGIKLMRALPAESALLDGTPNEAIRAICAYCGVSVSGSSSLSIPAAGLVTGSTCAEAISELVMLSGKVCYFDRTGTLVIADPSTAAPTFATVLSEDGLNLDTDSYATGCTVIVQRRKTSDAEKVGGARAIWQGVSPSASLGVESYSGSESLSDGSVTYEVEIYTPINATKRIAYTIRTGDTTKSYVAEYTYDTSSELVVRGDQEYRVWTWGMLSETLVTTISGSLTVSDGTTVTAHEETTKTTTRTYGLDGDLETETVYSVTERTSSAATLDMTPPAPPYDYLIERKYENFGFGAARLMTEVEKKYEKQSLTRLTAVTTADAGDKLTTTLPSGERYVLIPQAEMDEWVLVVTTKVVHEVFENGVCVMRATTNHSDEGGTFLLEQGYTLPADLEDPSVADAEKAFLALDTKSDKTQVETLPGNSQLNADKQHMDIEGRQRVYVVNGETTFNGSDWYLDGDYVPSRVCPHYSGGSCRISSIEVLNPSISGTNCPYRGLGWRACERATAALEKARSEDSNNRMLDTPVVCTAGDGDLWMSREVYIDEELTDEQAASIGTQIAKNILKAKAGARGATKTQTIPLDLSVEPSGAIVAVAHDWKTMHTTVTVRVNVTIPAILLPNTVSGAAACVSAREHRRQQRGYIGKVVTIDDDGIIHVLVANRAITCRTKLKYLAENDTVLISMPAGTGSYGMVVERL